MPLQPALDRAGITRAVGLDNSAKEFSKVSSRSPGKIEVPNSFTYPVDGRMLPPAGPDPAAVDPVVIFSDLLRKKVYRFVGDEPFE